MTRFPHDEFAKGFLESLLSPFGQVQTSFKISSEVREVDVYFQSNHSIKPIPELGLLGDIAQTDFVLEPFRNPPTVFQIRACMGKLFDLHANLIREAKRTKQPEPNNADLPMLWILAPTLSKAILAEYLATVQTDLVATGVYLLAPGCKTGIIVIHQLPKAPETLWFRLLGKEKVQSSAIQEVAALPLHHPGRQDALSCLGNLKVILEARESREPEEEELIMQLSPLYLEKIQAAELLGEQRGELRGELRGEQRGEQRGEIKGKTQGRVEEARLLVIRLLNRKLGNVSPQLLAKIEALPLERVELLGEDLLDFTSIANLEQWLG
jgi:Domain of unknown function (DUF4351)